MSEWRGRRVFITGHTGFKGSWLALWLSDLGAEVTGYALPPPTQPSLFAAANVAERVRHIEGDVRDDGALAAAVEASQPEIVFHLAAQPIVRLSYDKPVETYATNVMGTVHLLEAVRRCADVRATICITSDKCYENREWVWPYRETDPMGGHDPYSSSKGCAELVVAAYRKSYFEAANGERRHGLGLASVRAGNVIGGGDWASDRLLPDLVRAFERGETPMIRSPHAVRPWQHVLEAIGGYIMIAERLIDGDARFAGAWNFGPDEEDARPVSWIVDRMRSAWGDGASPPQPLGAAGPHEAGLLRLDSSKARSALGWRPVFTLDMAIDRVVAWHKQVAAGEDARLVTCAQIADYRTRYEANRPAFSEVG